MQTTSIFSIKALILMTLMTLCGFDAFAADKPLRVVSTIGQIHDIVKNVGGEHVKSIALMGPGVDPHLYKASAGDLRKLSKADIIFYNGLHLEAKMGAVFKKMGKRRTTVAVAEKIPAKKLLSDVKRPDINDPHIWFDCELWKYAIESVRDTLMKKDPANAETYKTNAAKYLAQAAELHDYVKKNALKVSAEQRVLVTAHDAFRYFGRAYGFEVRGLQGLSTVDEAGTKDVKELAEFIAQRKIRAMFVESSVPQRYIKAVQLAVESRGWKVEIGGELFSDAMGDAGTKEGTWIGMVRHNIDTIVPALNGKKIASE